MSFNPPFTVTKFMDEGTTSPFPARLMLQIFNFRDLMLPEAERVTFDNAYAQILDNFVELKNGLIQLKTLKEQHIVEVHHRVAAKVLQNRQITVNKSIDTEFRSLIKNFFIKGEIVISAIPRVGKVFGLRTGFFFGDPKKYDKEATLFRSNYPNADFVLEYLEWARSGWYKQFNMTRNSIEHDTFKIPSIRYWLDPGSNIIIGFPTTNEGFDYCELLELICNQLLELVECCLVFFFSTKLRPGQLIKEVPETERNPDVARKYKLYMRFGDQEVPMANQI